jgi:hypothetical protein
MKRITQKDLEVLTAIINKTTGSPATPYSKYGDNTGMAANIGNYHLDYAYGGVQLVRMVTDGGGITLVSLIGHGTKRELYNWMQAFLAGMSV